MPCRFFSLNKNNFFPSHNKSEPGGRAANIVALRPIPIDQLSMYMHSHGPTSFDKKQTIGILFYIGNATPGRNALTCVFVCSLFVFAKCQAAGGNATPGRNALTRVCFCCVYFEISGRRRQYHTRMQCFKQNVCIFLIPGRRRQCYTRTQCLTTEV